MEITIKTNSAQETIELGKKLGEVLKAGDVVALFGDLGAGKTTLTRGIAVGLGLDTDIHSPTFTLIHEHMGAKPLYHIDLYRLSSEEEAFELGIEEYIYGDGVTIIEWADRMSESLPTGRLDIELKLTGDDERIMKLKTDIPQVEALLKEMTKNVNPGN